MCTYIFLDHQLNYQLKTLQRGKIIKWCRSHLQDFSQKITIIQGILFWAFEFRKKIIFLFLKLLFQSFGKFSYLIPQKLHKKIICFGKPFLLTWQFLQQNSFLIWWKKKSKTSSSTKDFSSFQLDDIYCSYKGIIVNRLFFIILISRHLLYIFCVRIKYWGKAPLITTSWQNRPSWVKTIAE